MIEDYFQTFQASIARIFHGNGAVVGAGFSIAPQYLVTCAHVVAAALGIPLETSEPPAGAIELEFLFAVPGQRWSGKVVGWSAYRSDAQTRTTAAVSDVAVLQLEAPFPSTIRSVPLGKTEWGNRFRVFGFPQGFPNGIWASGMLLDRLGNGWVQIEDFKAQGHRVEPGFSGSPIWDETANGVVGMAVQAETQADRKVAFMLPAVLIRPVLPDAIEWGALSSVKTRSVLPSSKQFRYQLLEKRLKALYEECEIAYNQLSSESNDVRVLHQERRIAIIEQRIEQASQDMEQLLP
jgi:S1-C subfamily serine protease